MSPDPALRQGLTSLQGQLRCGRAAASGSWDKGLLPQLIPQGRQGRHLRSPNNREVIQAFVGAAVSPFLPAFAWLPSKPIKIMTNIASGLTACQTQS